LKGSPFFARASLWFMLKSNPETSFNMNNDDDDEREMEAENSSFIHFPGLMLVVLELSGNWKVTGKVIEWKCKEMVMETANSNHNSNKDQCQTGIYSDLVLVCRWSSTA
ncbi:hypothetical protein T4B_10346, partial [Trichinella pseudospiralis]